MNKLSKEILYTSGQCKGVLCNGKNRCDNKETITTDRTCPRNLGEAYCLKQLQNSPTSLPEGEGKATVASRCVYSRCTMQLEEMTQPVIQRDPLTICQSDADCVMAPCQPPSTSIGSDIGVWAMTKAAAQIQYTTGQCKGVLCKGKNRCDNVETIVIPTQACSSNTPRTECINQSSPKEVNVTSRCVNSWCRLSPAESSPSEGGASGQR